MKLFSFIWRYAVICLLLLAFIVLLFSDETIDVYGYVFYATKFGAFIVGYVIYRLTIRWEKYLNI